jgi:hypothetical protein
MDKRIFWVVIEATLQDSCKNSKLQEELIKEQLYNFELEDLIDFQAICLELLNGIYSSNIWAAGFAIQNGCSGDNFTEFRGWLIAQGERAYMNAVNHADSIYDVIKEYDVEHGYYPQMSLDLLVYSVVREKWGINKDDFMAEVKLLLSKKGFESTSNIEFNWDETRPETLQAIVPRLVYAYFDGDFWKDE